MTYVLQKLLKKIDILQSNQSKFSEVNNKFVHFHLLHKNVSIDIIHTSTY